MLFRSTDAFQKISFEVLNTTAGTWSAVTSEYVNINTKAVAPAVEPQYRVVVEAQDGTKVPYTISFNGKVAVGTFAYDTYSLTPILGTPTQKVIVSVSSGNVTVNQEIDNANDPIIAQDILDNVKVGHFQAKELQVKAKTVATWPATPTTISGFAQLDFVLNDYRLLIKSQDATANTYYIIVPNGLLAATAYGLVTGQTMIVSAVDLTVIVPASTAETIIV